ncbi:oxidoreductase [Tsukamurella ocularis]|uniref:oxidoreductase n=1 Tax=Tsukamurella ocularis TaxID=1970234 RepID=UPI0021683B68|nr:NADH:flavin oxidoreductase [Tsukamurella ocularis]MCS3778950.1 2,4-dienoyl-CoA reductase-like NADH-dependent reductase (Old Yellow Enzyme family) [Tsukamurella ocularis]MCS3787430.1 2,4-dienoyl-CoA reductase-like NADH-dependent reductase (Old Yellow Enzyme family) [Tsukamurella ocularis]MCS3851633.1 2,4-dienoyl-CoA reductase-like NADH-dependent reductase (Old Yellow Enzyme family) [Tsukamurella ocularis]
MTESLLSESLELPCGQTLSNRIAKAAMSEQLAKRDGTASDELRRLYAVWARGGAGLLLSGNIMIDRDALTEPGNVILDDARDLDAIRAWTGATKGTDAKIWAQINHPGKVAVSPFNRRPVAPSARRSTVPGYNIRKPRELSSSQVKDMIAKYARTAELAVAGGFDGVQVHAAHGYLLSQFLSPLSNQRNDEWGGDETRRMRALLETVAAVRAAVGDTVPVSVKLNSTDFLRGGFESEQALNVALALDEAGIDLLEISGGGYEQPAMTGVAAGQGTGADGRGYFFDFAQRIRAVSPVPIMLTGGLRNPAAMEEILAGGVIDVIGIGRPLTFVPDYPRQLLNGHAPELPKSAPRVGYRPANGYLELAWHNNQLHRIAAGKTPQRRPGIRTLAQSLTRITVAAGKQMSIPR